MEKHEYVGTKHDSKSFIECSNTMDEVYENIDDYNPNIQRTILISFDDMSADIMKKKNSYHSQRIIH